MNKKFILSIALIFSSLFIFSCSGSKMSEEKIAFPKIQDVPIEKWVMLSQRKIFFAHKSVGYNIMEGVNDVLKENPEIKLNIVESDEADDYKPGVFGHTTVGKNADPQSKINGFVNIIDKGMGEKADFVALKFCWADMMSDTNVNQIHSDYNKTVSQLRRKYPDLIIIHFTAPLTTNQTGPKAWFKKLSGKPVWGAEENIKRNKYNALILNRYKGKEPVFDIANIESTYPDGTRSTFTKGGKTFYIMVPEYTSDHGHLNEAGRKKVAEQFLIFLAKLV